MKHTPGPWTTYLIPEEDDETMNLCVGTKDDEYWIATVGNQGEETAEANARLIVEAPMMFIALKELYEEINSGNCEIDEITRLSEIRDMIRRIEGKKLTNYNCLKGYRCPKCGSEGPFWIAATIYANVLMSDYGTIEERETETNWDARDDFRCSQCGYDGTADEFNPEGYK